ncbi:MULTISPECIES: hypothetical protein [unclassified Sphingomonas]|uniref:hypothetical protein n=1 Tax=unclassified Sphingomonas TaxID=196159 RepID=UPI00226A1B95|nr:MULTISPECIES: hypothetical protein [unclassified Sphingomonas]
MPGTFLTAEQCARIERLARVHDDRTIAELTGASTSTIYALRQRGFKPVRRAHRPLPTDWGLVAPGRTSEWLRVHYAVSPKVMARWRREKPVAQPGKAHRRRARPADLRDVLSRMSVAQAEAHYGCTNAVLSRWRREIGIATRFEQPTHRRSWVEQRIFEQQVPA